MAGPSGLDPWVEADEEDQEIGAYDVGEEGQVGVGTGGRVAGRGFLG